MITRAIFSSSAISPALFCKPPRGVDQQDIGLCGPRPRQRLKGKPRRIGACAARNDFGACALSPDLQLLDGGGAERVARRQYDLQPLPGQPLGELADGGGLAGAVDARHQDHEGLFVDCRYQAASGPA